MKRRLAPASLVIHLQRPWRLGSALRGYEPLLRIGQLVLLLWVALAGSKLLAVAIVDGVRTLAGLPF